VRFLQPGQISLGCPWRTWHNLNTGRVELELQHGLFGRGRL